MAGRRFIPVLLTAAIFLLQGAECVSLFLANQPAHDCCRKAHGSPKNPDPCCQVSANTIITQAQAKEKAQLLDLAALAVVPTWPHSVIVTPGRQSRFDMTFAPSPPGQLGNFTLPLLV